MFRRKENKKWFGIIVLIVCLSLVGTARADWPEQVKLLASDGAAEDHFGIRVSIDGDYAIAGAAYDDDDGTDSGSAYIFEKPGGGWVDATETAKLTASDGAAGDSFGLVSISGDYCLVGAYADDSYRGSAYIFKRDGTNWTQIVKLTASDGASNDKFGISVSLDGDYSMVGAYVDDNYRGSAYIFKRVCPISDLTADCRVDFEDFAIMAGEWLQDN